MMLTARGDVTDRIVGLELGADDYLPKPFEPRELVARLQAVLRRADGAAPPEVLRAGALEVHVTSTRGATLDGRELSLTTAEFALLGAARCGIAAASSPASASSTRRAASTGTPTTARSTCSSAACGRSSATTRAASTSSARCAAPATLHRGRRMSAAVAAARAPLGLREAGRDHADHGGRPAGWRSRCSSGRSCTPILNGAVIAGHGELARADRGEGAGSRGGARRSRIGTGIEVLYEGPRGAWSTSDTRPATCAGCDGARRATVHRRPGTWRSCAPRTAAATRSSPASAATCAARTPGCS